MRPSTRLVVIGLGIIAALWTLAGISRVIDTHSQPARLPAGSPQMSLTATPTTHGPTPRTRAITMTTWPSTTASTTTIWPTETSSRARPLSLPPAEPTSACPKIPDAHLLLHPGAASLGADPGPCTPAAAARRIP
jgi:hypothetical protein